MKDKKAFNYLPRWGVLLIDVLLCTIAFWLSVWIGSAIFDYDQSHSGAWKIENQYGLVIGVQIIFFILFHSYAGMLRYSTFVDTLKSLLSNLSTGFVLVLFNLLMQRLTGNHPILNTVLVIYVPISFVLLFCLRVGVKTIYETLQQTQGSPKVVIYGTQSAGLAIAKMLRSAGNAPYRPIAFICTEDQRYGYEIAGLPVRRINDKLFAWMNKSNIHHVIVSPLKMREINPAKDLQIFIDHNIRILTTPYFTQFDNAEDIDIQRIGRIDAIRIEDLLERPKIEINTDNVQQILQDKVVLISGAAGSIGSELVRQVQRYEPHSRITTARPIVRLAAPISQYALHSYHSRCAQ